MNEFNGYPYLKEFIKGIEIYESGVPGKIEFEKGGAYNPDDAVNALLKVINDKLNKEIYQNLKTEVGLTEFYLIVYHHMALVYNSPFHLFGKDIYSIIDSVKKVLVKNHYPFDKIFLFIAKEPRMGVFALYP